MSLYKEWFKNRKEEAAVGNIKGSLPFLKLIPKNKKKILVVGCGEGHEVKWLNDQGFEVVGITTEKQEVERGKKRYGIDLKVADMHELKKFGEYDVIFASNVLEHSPMPFLTLMHWRKHLKKDGWVVLAMPSKEWLGEYYHYSVLNRSQVKELLYKTGFELLAGPQMKAKIDYQGGDVFYDMGRLWGFNDGYVARITSLPKEKGMLKYTNEEKEGDDNYVVRLGKIMLKGPYNKLRIWYARNYREW